MTQEEKKEIRVLVKNLAEETGSHIHTEWIGDAEVLEIVPTRNNGNLSLKLIYTYDMQTPSIDLNIRSNYIKYTAIQTQDSVIAYGLLISIYSKHLDTVFSFERATEIIGQK